MIDFILKHSLIRLHVVLIWVAASGAVQGQLQKEFIPTPVQDTIPSRVLQQLMAKLEVNKSRADRSDSKSRSSLKQFYQERFADVVQQFNDDYFIADTLLSPYLQSIVASIYRSNPTLSPDVDVFAYRSSIPNAMSFGEGTIAFTLGLLDRMESEDQIAFVLCHELAHYHARHSEIKAVELARVNSDREIRKKVKTISRSEYGQFTKYSQLIKDMGLSIYRHSREKEFEADSIALLFYANTAYDLHAPIRTMEILDSADVSKNKRNIDFKNHFSFTDYPFKEQWINYSKSETWYASQNDFENDSTRTHPSCKKRIIALKRQLLAVQLRPKVFQDTSDRFSKTIHPRIAFEMIESSYQFKNYGKTLFNSLLLIRDDPGNAYLHAMIGRCMYQLYQYQKKHELGKVLLLPDSRLEENYDRCLTFIHQLRLIEVASLGYYYTYDKRNHYTDNEDFLYTRWLSSTLEVSKENPDILKKEYQSRFPSGRYNLSLTK